jgi:hypothetical protein
MSQSNQPPRDIKPTPFPILQGTDDQAKQKYVIEVYNYVDTTARAAIDWYLERKGPKRAWAQRLRLSAILLTTIGGIIPLLVSTGVLPRGNGLEYAQFGYVALALAGACLALDKFFGFSSAWMRYLATSTALQRLLNEFYFDCALLNSNLSSPSAGPSDRDAMLRRAQTFLQAMLSEIEKETTAWVAEYRSNLADLEKSARQELESSKPGVINLTVTNIAQFKDGVVVLVDDQPRQTTLSTVCQITPVFPGDHLVRVKAIWKGNEVTDSKSVKLAPGQTVSLTLTLPTP